jgi:apolipoprotein N-acyltransferase
MFANFFNLFARRPDANATYEGAFVPEVHVVRKRPRNPRMERLLVWMWVLIAAKSAFVWWACSHYPVPFSAMWVIGPTVLFGILVTAVYASHR